MGWTRTACLTQMSRALFVAVLRFPISGCKLTLTVFIIHGSILTGLTPREWVRDVFARHRRIPKIETYEDHVCVVYLVQFLDKAGYRKRASLIVDRCSCICHAKYQCPACNNAVSEHSNNMARSVCNSAYHRVLIRPSSISSSYICPQRAPPLS